MTGWARRTDGGREGGTAPLYPRNVCPVTGGRVFLSRSLYKVTMSPFGTGGHHPQERFRDENCRAVPIATHLRAAVTPAACPPPPQCKPQSVSRHHVSCAPAHPFRHPGLPPVSLHLARPEPCPPPSARRTTTCTSTACLTREWGPLRTRSTHFIYNRLRTTIPNEDLRSMLGDIGAT